MTRSHLRQLLFANLMNTLGLLLGVMQVVVGHWVVVVLAGRPGPGIALGLLLAALLVAANALALPTMRRARRGEGWPRLLAHAYMAMGLATLLLGFTIGITWLGFAPLALVGWLAGHGDLVFQVFRVASGVVVLSLAALLLWGFVFERRRIDHTHVRVELPGLAGELRGTRVVQISDLHIGNGLDGEALSRLVERVNALEGDLVALTGDLFDFEPRFVEDGARRLAALRARLGVYAVLGNHDTYTGSEAIARAFAKHAPHVQLLRGEIVRTLEELETLASLRPDDGPVLLLIHRPELFPQAARLGFPFVLAGHTHGGQLALPMPGGRWNLARLVTRFSRGLYRENGSVLYVNRGVGFAGPMLRINCAREIATIELA
jgi:predicted MPP superfamily phosphohydrolase